MTYETDDEIRDFYGANKSSTDAALRSHEQIQKAYDKLEKGSLLSSEEITKLLKLCPSLSGEITKVADKYTLDAERLKEANEAVTKSTVELYTKQKELLERQRSLSTGEEAQKLDTQISAFGQFISMFELSGSTAASAADTLSRAVSGVTPNIKLINTALKEMNESGRISSDTFSKLVKAGDEYAACTEIQNGLLTVNTEKLKALEEQQYKNALSANSLKEAELRAEAQTLAQSNGDWQSVSAEISRLEAQDKYYTALLGDLAEAGSAKSASVAKSAAKTATDKTDYAKAGFNAYMSEYENAHDRGLISDEAYYDALERAGGLYYQNSPDHKDDLEKNITKIYNGRRKIYSQKAEAELSALERSLSGGSLSYGEYAAGVRRLAENYFGEGTAYYGQEQTQNSYDKLMEKAEAADRKAEAERIKQAADAFERAVSELTEKLEKGFIGAGEYSEEYNALIDENRGVLTEESLKKHLTAANDPDRLYEEKLRALGLADDGSYASAKDTALERIRLAEEFYKETDPNKYRAELTKTANYELSAIKSAYSGGVIGAKEYESEISALYERITGMGGELPAGFISSAINKNEQIKHLLSEWEDKNDYDSGDLSQRGKRAEYMLSLALGYGSEEYKKEYKNELKKLEEAELSQYKKEINEEREKVSESYDERIEQANAEKKRLEEINALERKRTELVRARDELEEVSGRRNVLIFNNGGYEYTSDPDAVKAAAQKLAKLKAQDAESLLHDEAAGLKEQKAAALRYYDELLSRASFGDIPTGLKSFGTASEQRGEAPGSVTINGGVSINMSETTPAAMIAEFAEKLSAAVLSASNKIYGK